MLPRMADPDGQDKLHQSLLPTEVEIYINPDGSVTFADLEASLVLVAQKLDPASPARTGEPLGGSSVEQCPGG